MTSWSVIIPMTAIEQYMYRLYTGLLCCTRNLWVLGLCMKPPNLTLTIQMKAPDQYLHVLLLVVRFLGKWNFGIFFNSEFRRWKYQPCKYKATNLLSHKTTLHIIQQDAEEKAPKSPHKLLPNNFKFASALLTKSKAGTDRKANPTDISPAVCQQRHQPG